MVHIQKDALALSLIVAAVAYKIAKDFPLSKGLSKLPYPPIKTKGPVAWLMGHVADDMLLAYGDVRGFFSTVQGGPDPLHAPTHFRIGRQSYVAAANPADIHHVHHSDDYKKPTLYKELLGRMLGEGLVTSVEKERHEFQRKLLSPGFSPQSLKYIADAVVPKHAQVLMDRLYNRVEVGESFQVEKDLRHATISVMADAIFRTRNLDDTDTVVQKFSTCLHNQWSWLRVLGLDRFLFIRNRRIAEAREFFTQKTKEVVKEIQDSGTMPCDNKTTCIMDYLVFTKEFTLQDILDHSMTFMFAGQDTTAVTLNWMSYHMARNPEMQQKLYEELCDAIAPNTLCRIDDLKGCRYLEICLKESQRRRGVVGNSVRIATDDDVLPGTKTFIPKGTPLFTQYWVPMHHPDIWGADAEDYRPERWFDLTDEQELSFLPFSSGKWNCLGKDFAWNEIMMLAAVIFRNFKMTWPEGHPDPTLFQVGVIMPNPAIKVNIESRHPRSTPGQ